MNLLDYRGGGIVNLMASLQQGLDGGTHAYAPSTLLPPARIRDHRQVLLWVIDGMGLNLLRDHPQAACLNEHLVGGMSTVFPPTTATAITSYLTGEAPQQHGLTGWHMYFRELGAVLAVLPGRARYGGVGLSDAGIDTKRLLSPRPFADRIGVPAYVVSPDSIAGSDFNRAHLGRAELVAYHGLDGLMQRCQQLLQAPGRKYLYAYWPELDALGHRHGIGSEAVADHLLELDRAFEQLLEHLRGTDTLTIVCADHGQIDPAPQHRIDLDDHPVLRDCLALPLCGEPRTAYCYLKPGHEAEFDAYVGQALDGIAESLPSTELLASGWFGEGTPHPRLGDRVGDRVLCMKEDFVIRDWLPQERRVTMIGMHGGLSDDERLVPLVIARS